MNDRKTDKTRNIGLKDIDEIGCKKANKETWGEVADRISTTGNVGEPEGFENE
jgi:hypothetical protein